MKWEYTRERCRDTNWPESLRNLKPAMHTLRFRNMLKKIRAKLTDSEIEALHHGLQVSHVSGRCRCPPDCVELRDTVQSWLPDFPTVEFETREQYDRYASLLAHARSKQPEYCRGYPHHNENLIYRAAINGWPDDVYIATNPDGSHQITKPCPTFIVIHNNGSVERWEHRHWAVAPGGVLLGSSQNIFGCHSGLIEVTCEEDWESVVANRREHECQT